MKKRLWIIMMATVLYSFVLSACTGKGEKTAEVVESTDMASETTGNETEIVEEDMNNIVEEEPPVELSEPLVIEKLDNINYTDEYVFTCEYDGIEHDVILDLPENSEGAPLAIMLPGYGQTAEGFRSTVMFQDVALTEGFVVAYVTGAPDAHATTASTEWNSGMGLNENKDVEFLVSLAQYLENEYHLSSERTYAIGFSNGAFMTHRIAVEAGDTFEAVVSVAGMMPKSVWEKKKQNLSVGVFQITGLKDDVVPKNSDKSADHNPNPAIEDVVDYYVSANGLTESGKEEYGKSILTKYSADTGKQVWSLEVYDGRHSWPTPEIQKIDTNQLIIDFLNSNK